jgi:pyridoxal biosynthesis lyase PdxS
MAKDQSEAIREIMLETARVQLAGLTAGIEFWSGWVQRTARFAQEASKSLQAATEKKESTDQMLARLIDSNRAYLRQVTELPDLAVARFKAEVGKSTPSRAKRTRAARAKD